MREGGKDQGRYLRRQQQTLQRSKCHHVIDQRQGRSNKTGKRLVRRASKDPISLRQPTLQPKEVEGCVAIVLLLEERGLLHVFYLSSDGGGGRFCVAERKGEGAFNVLWEGGREGL